MAAARNLGWSRDGLNFALAPPSAQATSGLESFDTNNETSAMLDSMHRLNGSASGNTLRNVDGVPHVMNCRFVALAFAGQN